jgi:hypothetical protein
LATEVYGLFDDSLESSEGSEFGKSKKKREREREREDKVGSDKVKGPRGS